MNEEEFKKLYLCTFEPDERTIKLDEELEKYYAHSEHCSENEAVKAWHNFRHWARTSGYSSTEVNWAKGRVQERISIKRMETYENRRR